MAAMAAYLVASHVCDDHMKQPPAAPSGQHAQDGAGAP